MRYSRKPRGIYEIIHVYVGGACGNSNVEIHDLRLSIGKTPEDCYDDLRKQWWGDPRRLHLDCWGEVEQADGFDVAISATAANDSPEKLFVVNLGGYDPGQFSELHKNILVVAADSKAAGAKAFSEAQGWTLPHKDNVFEVEQVVDVNAQMSQSGYSVVLTKATDEKPFQVHL